jgi:SAM-dependent methyltransferase
VTWARRFIEANEALSERVDGLLPARFRIDGNADFRATFVGRYLGAGATVYDIGGGKRPFIGAGLKRQLNLRVTGIDISRDELARAPPGSYDREIAEDIARFRGEGDADVVICQALLEHVKDNDSAFRGIASCLRDGGVACLFAPSRNAVFARLNLLLPQALKERLLFSLYPGARGAQGFPSYYDQCTPADFTRLAEQNGLEILEARHYYVSKYFSFFVPLHVLWRLWILSFHFLRGSQAAETFSMALRKR